jgi:hypothetical protein
MDGWMDGWWMGNERWGHNYKNHPLKLSQLDVLLNDIFQMM